MIQYRHAYCTIDEGVTVTGCMEIIETQMKQQSWPTFLIGGK